MFRVLFAVFCARLSFLGFSIIDIGERFIALKAGDLSVQLIRYFSIVIVVQLRIKSVLSVC